MDNVIPLPPRGKPPHQRVAHQRLIAPLDERTAMTDFAVKRQQYCANPSHSPRYKTFDGDDALAFVLSANLYRRHLDASQRSMIAAGIANLSNNQRVPAPAPIGAGNVVPITQEVAAKMLNVGRRNVQRARTVQESGDSELIKQVESGETSVNQAVKKIAARKAPAEKRKRGKAKGRDRGHERARFWTKLRDALESINGMPDTTTIINTVPAAQREMVSNHLPIVIDWLADFRAEWEIKQAGTGGLDAAAIELRAIARAWDRISDDARRKFAANLKEGGWL